MAQAPACPQVPGLRPLALLLVLAWGNAQAEHPAHDGAAPAAKPRLVEHSMTVTAFAYTADSAQTDSSEDIGAWGDELDRKVPSIAVSRDLLALGLKRGTKVRIKGQPGDFVVLDLMNPRWKKSIDIFKHRKKEARRWGRRRVHITWQGPETASPQAETSQQAGPHRP
jgi:3D (Asp-Asp-Asp) domain-containing protein